MGAPLLKTELFSRAYGVHIPEHIRDSLAVRMDEAEFSNGTELSTDVQYMHRHTQP